MNLLFIKKPENIFLKSLILIVFIAIFYATNAQPVALFRGAYEKEYYTKIERMIPMRDGARLFTAIYIPKDTFGTYPFLITRNPYSCTPYGESNYPVQLGPNSLFKNE